MTKKRKKMRGKVERIVKPLNANESEKAQIEIDEAEPLYREIRVENEFVNEQGEKEALKPGAEVDIVVEADSNATVKKPA